MLSKGVVRSVIAHWEHTRNRHHGHATDKVSRDLVSHFEFRKASPVTELGVMPLFGS